MTKLVLDGYPLTTSATEGTNGWKGEGKS